MSSIGDVLRYVFNAYVAHASAQAYPGPAQTMSSGAVATMTAAQNVSMPTGYPVFTNATAEVTSPVFKPTITSTTTSVNSACATIGQQQSSYLSASPSASIDTLELPAELAYDCLITVPVDVDADTLFLTDLIPYLEFQSTLAYLKDPPSGYLQPPTDLIGGVQEIIAKLPTYRSEWDFQLDLSNLIYSAKDGHLAFFADAFNVFGFLRNPAFELVSISLDGHSLPQIFLYNDIALNAASPNASISPVSRINGEDAVTYITAFSRFNNFQDPDALYNTMFAELAQAANGASYLGSFVVNVPYYPGPNTTITFANGTVVTLPNLAVTTDDFSGIFTGEDFYNAFCSGNVSAAATSAAASSTAASSTAASTTSGSTSASQTPLFSGFPVPVVADDAVPQIAGYYLNGSKYSNVAVLGVNSFEPLVADFTEFQDLLQMFLATSKAAGKTKLIIDLTANGGGDVFLGFDMFKQLFPSLTPWGTTNMRHNEAFDLIGNQVTTLLDNPLIANNESQTIQDAAGSMMDGSPTNSLTVNLTDFPDWAALYSPGSTYNGDTFTNLVRLNLTGISGEPGPRANITTQYYSADDILLIYDGYCASTCGIFSELAKTQGGVRSMAIGGRPSTGPMQGVGGVKGAELWPLDSEIWQYTQDALSYTSPQNLSAQPAVTNLTTVPLGRCYEPGACSVNGRNNIRQGDASLTPLQFVYEAADCRIWWTPAMIFDQTAVWEGAVDAWNNQSLCVQGSTGQPSSLSGNATLASEVQENPNSTVNETVVPSVYGIPPTATSSIFTGGASSGKKRGIYEVIALVMIIQWLLKM